MLLNSLVNSAPLQSLAPSSLFLDSVLLTLRVFLSGFSPLWDLQMLLRFVPFPCLHPLSILQVRTTNPQPTYPQMRVIVTATTATTTTTTITLSGARELAQWSRVLAVLAEDGNSVPSTHTRGLTTTCNSRSREPNAISGLPRHSPHTHT